MQKCHFCSLDCVSVLKGTISRGEINVTNDCGALLCIWNDSHA